MNNNVSKQLLFFDTWLHKANSPVVDTQKTFTSLGFYTQLRIQKGAKPGKLCRGVEMGEATPYGSSVSCCIVTNPTQGFTKNRKALVQLIVLLDLVLAGHGCNSYRAI